MLVDDIVHLRELLDGDGYVLKERWPENLGTMDSRGNAIDAAFVLRDPCGREIDVRGMRLGGQGNGIPAWDGEGRVLRPQDLAGEGVIAGVHVRCSSPGMQVLCHTGYELPDAHVRDPGQLHTRFGVELPGERSSPGRAEPRETRKRPDAVPQFRRAGCSPQKYSPIAS